MEKKVEGSDRTEARFDDRKEIWKYYSGQEMSYPISIETLYKWMRSDDEGENLEFKEAKRQFDTTKLAQYCAALSNEGGGHLVLGVTNKKPRQITGTSAFTDIETRKRWLLQKLHVRIDVSELQPPDGRVVVFSVPARPVGWPVQVDGKYPMRSGESLTFMNPETLRSIFEEGCPDFSVDICRNASIDDLDPRAIEIFRNKWMEKTGDRGKSRLKHEQILEDAELLIDGQVTYAALILLGKQKALGRHLGQAEVIYEWRLREGVSEYHQRREFREGFLLFHDKLWELINQRNEIFQYQDGLFRVDIPTFREDVIREAVLNAIAHRSYRHQGSVFIRHWPSRMEIVSPGSFPEGITPENILWRQNPRNRRIAEAFGKCGLVDRSGQGADRMFEFTLRDGKMFPDYGKSDEHEVCLVLDGQVRDPLFVKFLEKISARTSRAFGVEDLVVLASILEERQIPDRLVDRLKVLQEADAIKRSGRKYILARKYYQMAGRKGEYTRKRGLDRETNKELLLRHINDHDRDGSPLSDLVQVLPDLSYGQVRTLLQEMKREGSIDVKGRTRAGRWFLKKSD